MKEAAILRHRAKVQLIPDEELERRMPRREGTVELVMNDGARINEHVASVRGTFDNPMSREEVIAKARDVMNPVLSTGNTTKRIQTLFNLESVKNVRELRPVLQRG